MPSVVFLFRDNNGAAARVRLWLADGLSVGQLVARAAALADAMQALSSATLESFELIWSESIVDAPPAAPDSDVRTYLLLFYGYPYAEATLIVPAPAALPACADGPYRDVRLDLEAPPVPDLLAALGSELAYTITPGGAPWPATCIAGGYTRYRGGSG